MINKATSVQKCLFWFKNAYVVTQDSSRSTFYPIILNSEHLVKAPANEETGRSES